MKFYLPLLAVSALFAIVMAAESCECDDDDTDCLQDCVTSTNQCLVKCGADNNCYTGCFTGWPGAEKAPQNYLKQSEASASISPAPSQSIPPMNSDFFGTSAAPSHTMNPSMHMGMSSVPFGMPTSNPNQRWNQPMSAGEQTTIKLAGAVAALFAAGFIIFA